MGSVSEGITGTVGGWEAKLSEVCGVSGRGCRWAWQSGRAGDLGRGLQTALTQVGMKKISSRPEVARFGQCGLAFAESVVTMQAAHARPTIPHSLVQWPYCT